MLSGMQLGVSTLVAALAVVVAVRAATASAAPVAPPAQQVAVGTWWDRTAPPRGGKVPQSRHYSIRSDLPVAQTKEYADHLDTMYDEYFRRLVKQAGSTVVVVDVPRTSALLPDLQVARDDL